jgi:hypothetical protein
MMIWALPATLLATMGAAFAEHRSLHGIFCHEVNYDFQSGLEPWSYQDLLKQ